MKLPILSSLMIAVTLLQAPAFAAVRPSPRPGDTPIENPRDDHGNEICDSFRHRCDNDRNDRDERPDRYPGGPSHGRHDDPYYPPYSPNYPDYPRNPTYPEYPRYPEYPEYPDYNHMASVQFYGVTRKSGGEWLRAGLNSPAYLDYVQVRVNNAGVKIHRATIVTSSGRRITLYQLSNTGTFYSSMTSEYIRAGERITAIDILAESMGGYADLKVIVTSSNGPISLYGQRY